MARLNEPPVTGESLESLKRRFIRQNREITRANSAQSIRIRNLECETSRLLSENITLREQNIQLQRQLESTSSRQLAVRSQLAAKLAEVSGLIHELGSVHNKPARSSGVRVSGGPEGQTPKRSPDQRNWKNAFSRAEGAAQQEGRLPPIVEDKLYPRRTLESADIANILADANDLTDSPDLGPPPVTRFEDALDFRSDAKERIAEDESGLGFSSIVRLNNLETRKKRRESSYTASSLGDSNEELAPVPAMLATPLPAQSLKSGAKRKFSARDADESGDSIFAAQKDDFQFNRRAGTLTDPSNTVELSGPLGAPVTSPTKTSRGLVTSRSAKPVPDGLGTSTTSRKALGEKSVNNSPVKLQRPTVNIVSEPKKEVPKKPKNRESDRGRPKPLAKPQRPTKPESSAKPLSLVVDSIPTPQVVQPDADPEPEADAEAIPAPLSPSPFAPSATATPHPPPGTPPPADFAATRPSRRQRGSVSYAEPNLRDKMRRPTKELVDAVGGDDKAPFQRGASARAESESRGEIDAVTVIGERKVERPREGKTIVVKAEASEKEAWKDLPLANGTKQADTSTGAEPLVSAAIEPTRDETAIAAAEAVIGAAHADKNASGSSAVIAALAGPGRAKSTRAKEATIDPPLRTSLSNGKSSELASAESTKPPNATGAPNTKSSRSNASSTASAAPRVVSLTGAKRTSRRYSSVPEAMAKDVAQRTTAPAAPDVVSRAGSTRRKEASGPVQRDEGEGVGEVELRGGGAALGLGEDKGEKGDRQRERADKVAGRRRSMMM